VVIASVRFRNLALRSEFRVPGFGGIPIGWMPAGYVMGHHNLSFWALDSLLRKAYLPTETDRLRKEVSHDFRSVCRRGSARRVFGQADQGGEVGRWQFAPPPDIEQQQALRGETKIAAELRKILADGHVDVARPFIVQGLPAKSRQIREPVELEGKFKVVGTETGPTGKLFLVFEAVQAGSNNEDGKK
jgi:hypothetical protein